MAQPRFISLDEMGKLGSLTTPIIADLAITSAKIEDGAITSGKLAPGAIDETAIADDSIAAAKLKADVFGAGVVPNGSTNAIDINVDNASLEIVADVLKVKSGGITTSLINIDNNLAFNQKEAIQFRVENLISDPIAGNPGRLIWRSDLLEVRVDDGTSFTALEAGGGGGGHTILDEGAVLPQRIKLNFIGAGVTVTDDLGNDQSIVTIPGGGAGSHKQDQFTVVNPANKTLTLSNTPLTESERVSWNGLILRSGASNDYTVLGTQITLTAGITLTVSDEISVAYSF